MSLYSAFGMILESEIHLPELLPAVGDPDVTVRHSSVDRVVHTATSSEEYVFNDEAGAFLIRNGREILVDRTESASAGSTRFLLLGRVMAILLRQRGWVPLHASGATIDGRTVLFLGPSGSGKSTTAAACHRAGHRVITDDVGAVRVRDRGCMVQPAWPRVRLFDDSSEILADLDLHGRILGDKKTYDFGNSEVSRELPLARIYIIDRGSGLRSERLAAPLAAALLNHHSFVKRLRSVPEVLQDHLGRCAAVAEAVPVHRLVRPGSLLCLPDLVRFVEADLNQG